MAKNDDQVDQIAYAKQCEMMATVASEIDKPTWLSLAALWRQRATLMRIRKSKTD